MLLHSNKISWINNDDIIEQQIVNWIYNNLPKFKDEYSDLDKNRKVKIETDDFVSTTLEKSRQYYLQALILIKKGDTISAARYFQQAIDNLNKLVSYPNIEYNHEFNDLSNIWEDYENYITNIDMRWSLNDI